MKMRFKISNLKLPLTHRGARVDVADGPVLLVSRHEEEDLLRLELRGEPPCVAALGIDRTEKALRLRATRDRGSAAGPYWELSRREIEVLRLLPSGLSQREIAAELYVSFNTVRTHTRVIFGKLGVASRAEAVARARELGLL